MKASLAAQQLPESSVPESALKTLGDWAGKVAAVDLVPGEPLVAERLVAPGGAEASGKRRSASRNAGGLVPARASACGGRTRSSG